MSDLFSDLPIWRPQVAERARALKSELASLVRDSIASRTALDAQVAALNDDWQALDMLIQEQFWRVAYYGVAGDDINYRRFFNVNDLAGLRMELPAVFRHAHARIIPLIEDGTLDGIRLDHVDGLLDPKRYFDDLRAALSATVLPGDREDPRRARAASRGLAGRGNDRLRLHQPRPRRDDQPGG